MEPQGGQGLRESAHASRAAARRRRRRRTGSAMMAIGITGKRGRLNLICACVLTLFYFGSWEANYFNLDETMFFITFYFYSKIRIAFPSFHIGNFKFLK